VAAPAAAEPPEWSQNLTSAEVLYVKSVVDGFTSAQAARRAGLEGSVLHPVEVGGAYLERLEIVEAIDAYARERGSITVTANDVIRNVLMQLGTTATDIVQWGTDNAVPWQVSHGGRWVRIAGSDDLTPAQAAAIESIDLDPGTGKVKLRMRRTDHHWKILAAQAGIATSATRELSDEEADAAASEMAEVIGDILAQLPPDATVSDAQLVVRALRSGTDVERAIQDVKLRTAQKLLEAAGNGGGSGSVADLGD
jgi:hypothetical protein